MKVPTKAALWSTIKECHRLLETAQGLIDPEKEAQWTADVQAVLGPCEGSKCPTVLG